MSRDCGPARRAVIVRRVTGTPAEVAAMVAAARQSGGLAGMTAPRRTRDGRVWVDLTLVQPVVRARPTAAVVAAVVVVAGLIVFAAVVLVRAVAAALPLIVMCAFLLGLARVLIGRRSHR